ncbi:hypothetical protein [Lentzea jiangxiensis]|uniref:hypothetical protein n=1 Tax=Lentzea jiangxiensis TaxID=641025 RepID=UPI00115FF915|nr:hypothetical protein [Lentzea jiangxiensis]
MAVVAGAGVWALLRFGAPIWLIDKEHPARPVLEALSWIAGIGGLVVAVVALVVARRQGRPADLAGASAPSPSVSQTATDGSAIVHGNVMGGAGGGPTVGVNFGQVGGPPDPTGPTRGQARPRRTPEGPDRPGSPAA